MKTNKKLAWLLSLTAATLLTVAPLCLAAGKDDQPTTVAEVKKETRDLLQALKSYSVEQRREAVENSKVALEKIDRHIDELEDRIDAQWDEMDQTARASARASLRELRRQRNKAAERFGSLKSSSAAAWNEMKKGFSEAYQSLQQAWERSEKKFDKE